jgi:glucuronate isomerase
MTFITEDFLLQSETARRLYFDFAADRPILDFHCHLSAREIDENRRFNNLWEIWLEGDHYKWRAMRANGVAEQYCTGDATPYEKYLAWAGTVPYTLRNPLYHWTHLELLRYFDIAELLDESSAQRIWERANAALKRDSLSAQGILRRFDVEVVCTTDDPVDSLEHHRGIARQGLKTRVLPVFRPDNVFRSQNVAGFNRWIERLGACTNVEIVRLADLLEALRRRHDDFHELGCRASDHGLPWCFADFCTEPEAAEIFGRLRSGAAVTPQNSERLSSHLLLFLARLDAEKGWVKQMHIGALNDGNPRLLRERGRSVGCDSMGDWEQAARLVAFFGRLADENALPKFVLYNVNPAWNYAFASIAGSFQDGTVPGKMQYGSAWWFMDQKEGMELQMNALSNTGLLSRFIGMVTDSRSFMSYPRHEYFRRILCNLIGADIERGELPNDDALVGGMIRAICYDNAARYFDFPPLEAAQGPAGESESALEDRRRALPR